VVTKTTFASDRVPQSFRNMPRFFNEDPRILNSVISRRYRMPVILWPWRYLSKVEMGDFVSLAMILRHRGNPPRRQVEREIGGIRRIHPFRDTAKDFGVCEMGIIEPRRVDNAAFEAVDVEGNRLHAGRTRVEAVSYFGLFGVRAEEQIDKLSKKPPLLVVLWRTYMVESWISKSLVHCSFLNPWVP
jgi:hypothetical protein